MSIRILHSVNVCDNDKAISLCAIKYCHVSGVCVTNKTGFGFDGRIYWTFIQLVTPVHKSVSDTLTSSDWTLSTSDHILLLRCTPSRLLTLPFYNFSARTPRKTSSVIKNACLLVRYLALDVLLLLSAYASGMCLPSRCLVMGTCITIQCCCGNNTNAADRWVWQ
jgi:hypothetical protein